MGLTIAREKLKKLLQNHPRQSGSLNIEVKRYYTDVSGQILVKTDPAIPAALKVRMPVFLLGNFDRVGGYNIASRLALMPNGVVFLMTYLHGYNEPFLWDSGFNQVQQLFKKGDIICVFTDSLDAPSAFCFIQQSCQYGALGSIISNTSTEQDDGTIGQMIVNSISWQTDNINQVLSSWKLVRYDNLGLFKEETYTNTIPPQFKLTDFIKVDMAFVMTQFFGINMNMLYETDYMNFNFNISK